MLGVVGLLGMLACTGAVWAQGEPQPNAQTMVPLPGTNLALGKTPTFSVAPNYTLTQGGDETDLTDGKDWQPTSKTAFWGEKGTVGWSWQSYRQHPGALVTIDLGAVGAIAAVGFDTAARSSSMRPRSARA